MADNDLDEREWRGASELSRRTAHELDALRNKIDVRIEVLNKKVDDRFDEISEKIDATFRWILGIFAVIIIASIGTYLDIRISVTHLLDRQDSLIDHQTWQDKQISDQADRRDKQIADQDARIRSLEMWQRGIEDGHYNDPHVLPQRK